MASTGDSNLQVETGETVLLSPESQRFSASYKQVYPRSIDEIRSLLGPSDEAAKALKTHQCGCASHAPIALVPPEDLTAKDKAIKARAKEIAVQAAAQYVRSPDPSRLAQWKPLIDRYIAIGNPSIWQIALADIEVFDGGTLLVSASTRVLNANNIKIHDTGRIKCQGNITIKCQTLQGIRRIISHPVGVLTTSRS